MQNDTTAGFWLSPQQRHLWRLQATETSQPFRAIGVVAVRGPLDLTTLNAALQMLIDRHEILRTTFRCLSGANVPAQVISEAGGLVLDRVTPEERDRAAGDDPQAWLLARALEVPFELATGPLLHVSLLPLPGGEHALCFCLPALCADSVGVESLVRELGRCYEAALTGRVLDAVAAQYADISEVLNEIARSEETKAGREYWLRNGLPGNLEARSLSQGVNDDPSFLPRTASLALPATDLRALLDLQRQGEGAVEELLLACWAALIWRLGTASPLIGVRQNGRSEGLEAAVGLLAKLLPVSFDPRPAASFAEFRAEVAGRLREAAEWQDYFDPEVFGEQNAAWSWAFEMDAPETAYPAGGVSLAVRHLYACVDRFEVKLAVHCGESLALSLCYDANRVAREEVERLARAFPALLSSALSRPDLPLDELEVLDAGARRRLSEYNATAFDYPRDACLHRLFERQVTLAPEALAASDGERRMTYAGLNARANQVASLLREMGVGPDVRVGLCVERSLEMLTGLWGILKAGGAYVPLDPGYPRERLSLLLSDSGAMVLLTVRAHAHLLETPPLPVLYLDELQDLDVDLPNPESGATAESLAYVIYTSGSTGTPKGVMVPHRAVVSYLSWCLQAYAVEAGQGAPVGSPLGFDLTVTSLLSPLL